MNYLKYLITFTFLFFVIVLCNDLASFSDGPPPARTGAPGELTCYNGYCHNSFLLNSGPAETFLKIDAPEAAYVAGETYIIRPTVLSPSMQRFGFQLQAVDETNKTSVGQFAFDSTEVQLLDNQGRIYITHSLAKTVADSAAWELAWTAPAAGTGVVNFYAAFVASDNSGNRSGDYVYTQNLSIQESIQTSLNPSPDAGLSIYPSLFVDQFTISLKTPHAAPIEISIIDLNGHEVFYDSRTLSLSAFSYVKKIETSSWARGLYIVSIRSGQSTWVRKIVKS